MKNKELFRVWKFSPETRATLVAVKLGIFAFLTSILYRPIHKAMTFLVIDYYFRTTTNENAKAVLDEFVSRVFLGDYGPVADEMYSADLWSGGLTVGIVVCIFILLCTLEKKLGRRK